MSINLLLESDTDPVIWRGPLIASMIKRFWADVVWGDVDFMFIDMPPGTGDVALTVFQSLPVDGIIIATSPQELVSMIVSKAVNMAKKMNIPILGIIENMSYLKCPDCGKEINVFGESRIEEVAREHGIPVLGKLPIDPAIATAIDKGLIEDFEGDWLDKTAEILEK
jgi:Mrp family chromosome partitioning ATPase